MPSRQYQPKRVRVGSFTADATMHEIVATDATSRLVSTLIFNNLSTTTDATITVVVASAPPANNAGGLKLTVPHRASLSYTSHASLTGITLESGWGIWYRVDVGATGVTAEAHYSEVFTGAPLNYDPKSAWVTLGTTYGAAIATHATKRRIITSVNGFCTTGADTSWYLYAGTAAPVTDTHGLRWAGINPASNPTNMMSTEGLPLHLVANDGLFARQDNTGATVVLQINYLEEQ